MVRKHIGWLLGKAVVSCVLLMGASMIAPTAWAAMPYSLTDLGTLGGGESGAYDINNAGQVVGYATTSSGVSHAFLYSGKAMIDLGTLGGATSNSGYINDRGQIMGWSKASDGYTVPFLYDNGVMHDRRDLQMPAGINNFGQIAGTTAYAAQYNLDAYLMSFENIVYLGTLGGTSSVAYGINDSGQVTGYSTTISEKAHAFRYSNGIMSDLGTLGGPTSQASGINANGKVVGSAALSNGYSHAFIDDGSSMVDLGAFEVGYSGASGINNLDQVVGDATVNNGWDDHGFLYTDGHMYDLNALIAAPDGWTIDSACAINDSGQIAAVGIKYGMSPHAILLTPVPEPSSLGVLGLAAVWLITRRVGDRP